MRIENIIKTLSSDQVARINEIHEALARGDDDYDTSDIDDITYPVVLNFVRENDIGKVFRDTYNTDTIEVILVEAGKGWLPSVRSDHWDAPVSTVDPELALADPKEAMAWGIGDALTQHLAEEGISVEPDLV
jgi:hypothetical protein